MSALELIKFSAGMIPVLIELVTAIEAAFPDRGIGAKKLDFVKNALAAIDPSGQYWPVVSKIVAGVVGLKNATGQFATTGAPDPGRDPDRNR